MAVSAERAAEGLLMFAWADSSGEIRLPVDPVQIATNLGIQVFEAPLEENISGSLVKNAGQDAVILLNRTDSHYRQRFTCAHEIGHFHDHTARADDETYAYVEHRSPLSATGSDPDEVRANRFAAALLMPEQQVRRLAADGSRTPLELAHQFGVSADAMTFRMKNLGII
jgi:Zn-dependent peptidase ImmA (M78 family)